MKKVLIITYYWPPAGGPGVQRVLKFAKYLPDFGWEPYILTVKDGEFPAIDKSLENDIPKNCHVYLSNSIEPFYLYKKFTGKKNRDKIPTYILNQSKSDNFKDNLAKWIRLNLFIPDAKIGWIPFAVSKGKKLIKENDIDIIFSSSPPQTVNLVAKKIATKSGLPWIADYRDPWTDAFWQEGSSGRNSLAQKVDKLFEKTCLNNANGITTVSNSLIELFQKKSQNYYSLMPNGFDNDDFTNLKKAKSEKFRINYIGYLGQAQKIDTFLEAVNSLDDNTKDKIDINFFGNIHQSILDRIDLLNLRNIINIHPYIPHEKAIKIMKNSEMLLLVIPDVLKNELIVTGKLFEYLATQNYILGIGPTNSDVVNILQQTNCGEMFDYSKNLKDVLLKQLKKWGNGESLPVNQKAINMYSRKNLAAKLAEEFNRVIT